MPLINFNFNNKKKKEEKKLPVANLKKTKKISSGHQINQDMHMNEDQNGIKEYQPIAAAQKASPSTQPATNDGLLNQQLPDNTPKAAAVSQPSKPQMSKANISGPTQEIGQTTAESQQPISDSQLQQKQYSLEDFLNESLKNNASDLHLSAGDRAMLRINGELTLLGSKVLTKQDLESYIQQIIKGRTTLDLEKFTQTDLSYGYKDRRFRVNIYKKMGAYAISFRIIPANIKSIEELNLPPIVSEFTKLNSGLVLVTGPTGSGKSTTLASIINQIARMQKKHIITLEDPIEYVFEKSTSLISQREFGSDFDSWPNALRSVLRQDPDILLVGEMRDYQTIASTITVSETGHLVFATLHTNSASQTIDRIVDVFPEGQQEQIRAQLANVLDAVISQRLVPLVNGGRKAVAEVLIATPAVKNNIREGKTHQINNIIQTGQDFGMISLEKSLAEMINRGEITTDAAMAVTSKPKELEMILNNG